MSEDMKCPYEEKCAERYPSSDMKDFRTQCDCVSCAMCDYYWLFYDERHMKEWTKNARGGK